MILEYISRKLFLNRGFIGLSKFFSLSNMPLLDFLTRLHYCFFFFLIFYFPFFGFFFILALNVYSILDGLKLPILLNTLSMFYLIQQCSHSEYVNEIDQCFLENHSKIFEM